MFIVIFVHDSSDDTIPLHAFTLILFEQVVNKKCETVALKCIGSEFTRRIFK